MLVLVRALLSSHSVLPLAGALLKKESTYGAAGAQATLLSSPPPKLSGMKALESAGSRAGNNAPPAALCLPARWCQGHHTSHGRISTPGMAWAAGWALREPTGCCGIGNQAGDVDRHEQLLPTLSWALLGQGERGCCCGTGHDLLHHPKPLPRGATTPESLVFEGG